MKKFKENKQNIKWSIERLESKLNDKNITPKEVKVILLKFHRGAGLRKKKKKAS